MLIPYSDPPATPQTSCQQSRLAGSPVHRPCRDARPYTQIILFAPYYDRCPWTLPLLPLSPFCRAFTHGGDLLLGLRMPRLTHSTDSHPLTHSVLLFPHDLILSHCGLTLHFYSHMMSCSLLAFSLDDPLFTSLIHYPENHSHTLPTLCFCSHPWSFSYTVSWEMFSHLRSSDHAVFMCFYHV
jgi:hypothetical protein